MKGHPPIHSFIHSMCASFSVQYLWRPVLVFFIPISLSLSFCHPHQVPRIESDSLNSTERWKSNNRPFVFSVASEELLILLVVVLLVFLTVIAFFLFFFASSFCFSLLSRRCSAVVYSPWVDHCVGYYNYKYFFLLLFHGTIASWYFVSISPAPLNTHARNPYR